MMTPYSKSVNETSSAIASFGLRRKSKNASASDRADAPSEVNITATSIQNSNDGEGEKRRSEPRRLTAARSPVVTTPSEKRYAGMDAKSHASANAAMPYHAARATTRQRPCNSAPREVSISVSGLADTCPIFGV